MTYSPNIMPQLLATVAVALALTGCGRSPEKAVKEPRKELAALNLQYTPEDFERSAANGDITAVKLFLDAGMAADTRSANGVPLLCVAASAGHHLIVSLLLDRGVDVNVAAPDGSTSLIGAASRQQVAVLQALLANKASVNMTNKSGGTALHWAVLRGDTNAVNLLLKHGASTSIEATNEMTAADCAVEPLLENGFDPKTSTNAMVVLLRNHGAKFSTRWLLGRLTAATGVNFYKSLTAEPQTLSSARFTELTNYVAKACVWLRSEGFDTNQAVWFQSQMADVVFKVWSDAPTLPTAEPERTKAKEYDQQLRLLLKELRAGVPERYLHRFPKIEDF